MAENSLEANSLATSIVGSCLCGSVTVSANPKQSVFDACHCGMCRKWGGGPLFTVEGGSGVKISGEEFVTTYSSSDWAERAFCKKCGTHLYYHFKPTGFRNFSAGLFKEADRFKFHMQIYIDAKPLCYEFANKTETMTEAQVIAKFT